jgi:hypothetical protein
MNLQDTINRGLSLAEDLQIRCQEFENQEVLEELNKYIQFFKTFPTIANSQSLYNHMRVCNLKKLYDEPEIYENLDVHIPLEGIVIKHLRDTLTLLDIYQGLRDTKKEVVFQEILSLLTSLPRSSPCLDAHITKLDRLVRILQTQVEDYSGTSLSLSLENAKTDHEIAYEIFQAFLQTSTNPTEEAFHTFVKLHNLLGNPAYKTLLIPTFQELLNLLIDIYQTSDFLPIV